MRREFKVIVECRDDEAEGFIDVEEISEKRGMKLAIPAVDGKVVGNRELAISFAFRTMALQMFRRCFPEYVTNNEKPVFPEQHGDKILYPGEKGHSSQTGIDR